MYHNKKKQYVLLIRKNKNTVKNRELNSLLSLSFGYALYGWLDDARKGEDGEDTVLMMAEEVKKTAEKGISHYYNYVSDEQKTECEKLINKIAAVWEPEGEPFTVYINFCLAVFDDVLRFEKLNINQKTVIEEVADLTAGLLTQFDSNYEDTTSSEKAARAFSEWKVGKF